MNGAYAQIGVNMKQGRKIFWGLMFVLGGVALIVSKMGFLEGFNFWSIVFTIALLGILVDGLFHRSWGVALFSLAFLIIVNDELLGLESITPWPVLGAALLGTIGIRILFPGKWGISRNHKWDNKEWSFQMGTDGEDGQVLSGEYISIDNNFGESVKYLGGNEISQVKLENAFGCLRVYFDNVILKDGKANVYVDSSFGSVILYIPAEWKVNTNLKIAFGDARESRQGSVTSDNIIEIHGDVSFGDLKIQYI